MSTARLVTMLRRRRKGVTAPLLPIYDYVIDAANGSDLNDGSSAAPWASLSKIGAGISSAGTVTRVKVVSGTYNKANDFILLEDAASGSHIDVTFEAGCIMDGATASAAANTSGIEANASGSTPFTLTVRGNGLIVRNYNYSVSGASPQGIGWAGPGVVINVHDVSVSNTIDGVSGHTGGHANLYNVTVENCGKWVIANVSASTMDCYDCAFRATGTESAGFATDSGSSGLTRFYDCEISCAVNPSTNWEMNNTEMHRTRFGTLTGSINVVYKSGGPAGVLCEDSFINGRYQLFGAQTFRRCYGKFSGRVRNDTDVFTMENSVFVGPATGLPNMFYSNFNDGGGARLVLRDNIFEATSAAAFMSVDATNAGYLVAKASQMFNNVLDGAAAYDADLIAADTGGTVIVGTVTGDPLIGPANTLVQTDYAFPEGAGSPAENAATDGGNIGFSDVDIAA